MNTRGRIIACALVLCAWAPAGCVAARALADKAVPPGSTISASFYGLSLAYTRGGETEHLEPALVTPSGALVTELDPEADYTWTCPGRSDLPVSGADAEAVLDWGYWLAQRPCDKSSPR